MRSPVIAVVLFVLTLPVLLPAQTPEQSARVRDCWIANDKQGLISACREVLRSEPENHYMMYTLAWAFAEENEPESSFVWMKRSIRHGNTDYKEFTRNNDFEQVRSLPGFQETIRLGKLKALEENGKKTIDLAMGEWTDVKLDCPYELPQIDASCSFDHENFYIRALVTDTHFKDGNRAWRYGDGFFINFVMPVSPDSVYSDRFYAYGFARYEGRPICSLVNRHGTYLLANIDDLAPEIDIDDRNNRADYRIAIPWSRLYPFHPLMDGAAGINIIYTSQNDNGTRRRIKYVPDLQYDSESTTLRRYAPIRFAHSPKSALHITGRLGTRLLSAEGTHVTLAVWLPGGDERAEAAAEFRITIEDEEGRTVNESRYAETLEPGRSIARYDIDAPAEQGMHKITVTLNGAARWEESFFTYDRAALDAMNAGIERLAAGGADPILQSSVDALTFHLDLLERRIAEFTERDDPRTVKNDIEELTALYDRAMEHGSIYTEEGYILSAFRSPRDGTTQPFSIYLPERFEAKKSYNLLVGLHGSGVSEVGFLRWTARTYKGADFIILGPRGRDLSAWWLGETEVDVADLVALTKQLFNIKRILLFGFSMGGYGVWRMSFLYPELFDAAICVSGSPYAFVDNTTENDMRNHIGKGKDIEYLVIHGTEDRAVEIEATDAFIERLKEAGYDIEYIRVDGGGHGNFSVTEILQKWLKSRFGD
jgi:predicted esterase